MGVCTFCPWSSKTTTTTTRTTCHFCLIKVAFPMECRQRSWPWLAVFHSCTRRRWWWRLNPQPQGATPPLFPSPFAVGWSQGPCRVHALQRTAPEDGEGWEERSYELKYTAKFGSNPLPRRLAHTVLFHRRRRESASRRLDGGVHVQ